MLVTCFQNLIKMQKSQKKSFNIKSPVDIPKPNIDSFDGVKNERSDFQIFWKPGVIDFQIQRAYMNDIRKYILKKEYVCTILDNNFVILEYFLTDFIHA